MAYIGPLIVKGAFRNFYSAHLLVTKSSKPNLALAPIPDSDSNYYQVLTNWYSDPTLELHQINQGHFTRFRPQSVGRYDPNTKLIFDELKAVRWTISYLQTSLMSRIDVVES